MKVVRFFNEFSLSFNIDNGFDPKIKNIIHVFYCGRFLAGLAVLSHALIL